MKMNEKEIEIMEDMKKRGYVLEADVVNLVMQKGWYCFPQCPYEDQESGKIRTIDMLASPNSEYLLNDSPKLLIECKKSSKPWVFFTPSNIISPKRKVDGSFIINEPSLFSALGWCVYLANCYPECATFLKNKTPTQTDLGIIPKIHFFNEMPIANSNAVAFWKGKKDSTDDFKKALFQLNDAFSGIGFSKKSIIFFVIILEGEMFRFNEKKELSKTQHILFSNLNMMTRKNMPPTLVDVITYDYLDKLLDIIREDMILCTKIREKSKELQRNEMKK